MSFLKKFRHYETFSVGGYVLRVNWITETAVGFGFGQHAPLPERMAGQLKISAFCSAGEIIVVYPCNPRHFCQISCMLPLHSFEELWATKILDTLYLKLGIPNNVGYIISVFDSNGFRNIDGMPGI